MSDLDQTSATKRPGPARTIVPMPVENTRVPFAHRLAASGVPESKNVQFVEGAKGGKDEEFVDYNPAAGRRDPGWFPDDYHDLNTKQGRQWLEDKRKSKSGR